MLICLLVFLPVYLCCHTVLKIVVEPEEHDSHVRVSYAIYVIYHVDNNNSSMTFNTEPLMSVTQLPV